MNEKVRTKVRKLLALAGSPNIAEARSAREMADKLMKKHNFTQRELEGNGGILEKEIRRFKTVRQWEDLMLRAVLDYSAVEAVYVPRGTEEALILIGREGRVVQAEELYLYLHDRLMQLGEDYRIVVKDKTSFRLGMAQAVSEQLYILLEKPEEKPEEPEGDGGSSGSRELVPAEENAAAREADLYIDKAYGKIGERQDSESFDPNSLGLGRAVGRKISLNNQLEK